MNNRQQIQIAKEYIGSHGREPRKYCGLPLSTSWCDAFVTYIFYKANNKELYCKGTKQTYCPASIKICKSLYASIPLYLAMPSDVIFFDWEHNGIPNHVGFVLKHIDTEKIKTIEGNTNGGVVASKTRPKKYVQSVFRPHFKGIFIVEKKLAIDGVFGYSSIAMLQKALGITIDGILGKATVKALQRKVGTTPDGDWGTGTSRKVQKMLGIKVDGAFGKKSVMALQKWCNDQVFKETKKPDPTPSNPTPNKPSKRAKLIAEMDKLAWKYGTPKKYWRYKTGRPRNACKMAMNKYGYDTKAEYSDCGNFVNTVVRQSGIDKHFTSLHAVKTPFPKHEVHFKVVISGRVPKVKELKPGDIIRYKKKGGDQHAMFYYGHNRICDAGHYNRFGNIRKNDFRYKRKNVKKSTIQVLRVKE